MKFERIIQYTKEKYISVNIDKTKYIHFIDNPTLTEIKIDEFTINPVNPKDGYNWLGLIYRIHQMLKILSHIICLEKWLI